MMRRPLKWYTVWYTLGRLDVNVLIRTSSKARAKALTRRAAQREAAGYGSGWGHDPKHDRLVCRAVEAVGPGTSEPDYITELDLTEEVARLRPHRPLVTDSGT